MMKYILSLILFLSASVSQAYVCDRLDIMGSNGLIQSFAAGTAAVRIGSQGFARCDKMRNPVNVIDIERSEIEDGQILHGVRYSNSRILPSNPTSISCGWKKFSSFSWIVPPLWLK